MNVLCLDQFSELGGAQRCLLDLLPALADRKWRAHVAAPGNGALFAQAVALHATAGPIRCGPYSSGHKTAADMARFAWETPRLAREIHALVRKYAADLVYVNGPRLLPAVALAARNGPPVLFHAHSLLDGFPRWLAGRALRATRAALVASCRFVASPLEPFAGNGAIRVAYNGVRAVSAGPARPLPAAPRIGVIGRISPEKGQADFLRAARMLHPDLPQATFVICGAPLFASPAAIRYRAELETLAEGLPVEYTGWQEDVQNQLARLDLLVVPSTPVDATPRVILEAFAAGVPVMAFAVGGIPEIVEHNVTGFLVRQRSPEALAVALRDLLQGEPHRLPEMVRNAAAKLRSEFSLARYQEQMIAVMETAARSRLGD